MTNTSFIDDLRDIPGFNQLAAKDRSLRVDDEEPSERETFPCEMCNGTGIYQHPRRHQPKGECFACKGKGFFYKSFKDRQTAKAKRVSRKQKIADNAKMIFESEHPGLVERVRKLAEWNDFARDMLTKFDQYHSWTDNQVAALERAIAKADARDAERNAAKQARIDNPPVINVSPLHDAFAVAVKSELKVPMLRYEGFNVKLSKKDGVTLYIRSEGGDYYGKIVDGRYIATREAEAVSGLVARITEAMNDPLAAAIAYGRKLGNCSCCGRRLVDPVSVANGIGPVCAERYGWDRIVPEEVVQERAAKAEAKAERAARKEAKQALRAIPKAQPVINRQTGAVETRKTKYEYAPGMSDADKRKLRAAARRAARG